jgi:hypothetical protein
MVKYIIIHNKHEGCYDFQFYEDEASRMRLTSITINPPKIFMFDDKQQAHDFFDEYINDVDVIDPRCKKGDDVEHINYCTCGIIELDDDENPILFYNKRNQIFLMEHGPQIFLPPQELKNDIGNLNLTNRLIRKAKSLGREQRNRYIELGRVCEECETKDKNKTETANTSTATSSTTSNSATSSNAKETKEKATTKEKGTKTTTKEKGATKPKKSKKTTDQSKDENVIIDADSLSSSGGSNA